MPNTQSNTRDLNSYRHSPRIISNLLYSLSIATCISLALVGQSASAQTLSEKVVAMERGLEKEFEDYFGQNLADVTQAPEAIARTLDRIGQTTGTKPAVLWVIPREDLLHLVLITPNGKPIVRDLKEVPSNKIREAVEAFHLEMHSSPNAVKIAAAQQLYQWILQPYEAEFLQPAGIDTILFCLGKGVRSLPMAALHDGKQFLIEKYNVSQIPAFNLIQTTHTPLQQGRILAMGASQFQELNPLPAVPIELTSILKRLQETSSSLSQWQGQSFLNQDFTLPKLQQQVKAEQPNVIHLATHAIFKSGKPDNSYIQLWNAKLGLNDLRSLQWGKQPPDLLVLSACRTAIGDDQAELGFAGLALKTGVKTALASLWNVSDEGTLALMNEFYAQLGKTKTKAEALRQAQLKLLRGEVRIEGKQLRLSRGTVNLPSNANTTEVNDLSAPYYWASFTLISSPW